MKKISMLIVVMVLFMSLAIVLASEPNKPNNSSIPKIVVGGTGDSQKLMRTLAKALMEKLGSGIIEVPDSIGSKGGIRAVSDGQIDLARVARPLKEDEKKLGLTYELFAKSPVVFAVNSSAADINNITTEQIIGIYSGKIKDWSQLGVQAGKIYPIFRESGDSSLLVLEEKMPGFADINAPAAKTIYSTPEAVAALTEHKGTIGFIPLSMAVGTQLRILKVNGVYPSIENVLDGKYEIVTPFGIVYKKQPKGLAKSFIDFIYSKEGQEIITRMGAIPAR
jgi:phosphate transport system substrate-binding protein